MTFYPRCRHGILATVDHTLVNASHSHFPCQIDLSPALSTFPAFKEGIVTAANIAVYDPSVPGYLPRIVDMDLPNSKLMVHFDAAINNSADKPFYILSGYNLAESDDADVFLLSDYVARWGFNEFTDVSTVYDSCYNYAAVETGSTAVVGDAGTFGNCIKLNTSYFTMPNIPGIRAQSTASCEYISEIPPSLPTGGAYHFYDHYNGTTYNYVSYWWDGTVNWEQFYFANGSYSASGRGNVTYLGGPGTKYHVFWSLDLTQPVVADRCKLFINGVQLSITLSGGTWPLGLMAPANTPSFNESVYSHPITLDEFGFMNTNKDVNFAKDRYNQFFNAGFWTLEKLPLNRNLFQTV